MIDQSERNLDGSGKKPLLSAFLFLAAAAAMIAAVACSKHDTDFGSNSPLYTNNAYVAFDSAKPADTLRFASLNMSIGFPVSQLLFTDMADTAIAYVVLDSLVKRYQRTLPSERIKAMAKIIVEHDLDVVGLQEVMSFNKDGVKINDFLSELVDQIKVIGGPAYQVIDNPLNDTVLAGRLNGKSISIAFHEGNAMLIRPGLQILESASFMYFTLLPIATEAGSKSQRALQYAKLRSSKGIFWNVYNTHLEVFQDISSSQALELRRLVDSVKIQNSAKEDGAPQIVIGDFNVNPNEDAHTVMQEGGFKDTYDTSATDPGFTCCITASTLWDPKSHFSNRRIDFVFGRHMVKVTEHRVLMKDPIILASGDSLLLSDHRMVVTSIVGQ
ncbi:MAG: endonuclease/exonuclease/phosphatase family protein [Fibrobacterota bacterium]|nr:endonuclease/exonuclease/phosphatase family protein [Fibrobacterota bacterium]